MFPQMTRSDMYPQMEKKIHKSSLFQWKSKPGENLGWLIPRKWTPIYMTCMNFVTNKVIYHEVTAP